MDQIKTLIGEYVLTIISLQEQLTIANKKIAEYEQKEKNDITRTEC